MLDKVSSQQHGLDIPIKFTASLQNPLERGVPLIRMSCIENFVMRIDASLQEHKTVIHKSISIIIFD